MKTHHHLWAVVLATGEGARLQSLTTDATGRSTPKQYCSLFGRSTLMHDALRRASRFAERKRPCSVVAIQHAHWWRDVTWALSPENLIAQPDDRGTAFGVLLPLLTILRRDPYARLLFLPSDHFVADEVSFAGAISTAVIQAEHRPEEILLVGVQPDGPDSELGYIVPRDTAGEIRRVLRFVEKPRSVQAEGLIGAGALWNSFIFVARGTALLRVFRERVPLAVNAIVTALANGRLNRNRRGTLDAVYGDLPQVDFSRDILTGSEARLRVVTAPGCGWTDLGTPRRVGDVVGRTTDLMKVTRRAAKANSSEGAPVVLSAQYLKRVQRVGQVREARP